MSDLFAHWRPHPGPQTQFLQSQAYELLYGGAAGGGKSVGMLADAAQQIHHRQYAAVLFRKTYKQLEEPGGLIPRSIEIYPYLGGTWRIGDYKWTFASGAAIVLRHMQYSGDRYNYQGAEYAYIGFDQLEQFAEDDYLYLFSRARTPHAGILKRVRATANPGAEWILKRWLPWLGYDEELKAAGMPRAQAGELLWFARIGDEDKIVDPDHPEALSRTFIPATVYDNPTLMENDPDYVRRLKALPYVERRRLLDGDWHVQQQSGNIFRREHMAQIRTLAPRQKLRVRGWDLAATKKETMKQDPDYTATALWGFSDVDGLYWWLDADQQQLSPLGVQNLITHYHETDPPDVIYAFEQEPGQAGKAQAFELRRRLVPRPVVIVPRHVDKIQFCSGLAAAFEADMVAIWKGAWNSWATMHFANFPSPAWHDDIIDASAVAFFVITSRQRRKESDIR